jgi:hypothetical protein
MHDVESVIEDQAGFVSQERKLVATHKPEEYKPPSSFSSNPLFNTVLQEEFGKASESSLRNMTLQDKDAPHEKSLDSKPHRISQPSFNWNKMIKQAVEHAG